jgi:hypothetical protein
MGSSISELEAPITHKGTALYYTSLYTLRRFENDVITLKERVKDMNLFIYC